MFNQWPKPRLQFKYGDLRTSKFGGGGGAVGRTNPFLVTVI